eukprot:gene9510-12810_t
MNSIERPTTKDFVDKILKNIQRRSHELEQDLQEHILLENKLVTTRLATIKGLGKHFNKALQAQQSYERQEILDPLGHSAISRADMHRK